MQTRLKTKPRLKCFSSRKQTWLRTQNVTNHFTSHPQCTLYIPIIAGPESKALPGALVPKGFNHYPSCSCYKPNPNFPRPTLEMAELEMLSESEARHELARLCTLVRTQRILYRTKEMCMQQRYQNKINTLTKQLNNNGNLWEQLCESDKREKVLKSQLLFTQ